PDGKTAAIAQHAHKVVLWDVRKREKGFRPIFFNAPMFCVSFSPDGKLLAAGGGKSVEVGDAVGWKPNRAFQNPAVVRSVAFSPDSKTLAWAGDDSTITLWDRTTSGEVEILGHHGKRIDSLCFSPDGVTLATASWDRTAKLWDLST